MNEGAKATLSIMLVMVWVLFVVLLAAGIGVLFGKGVGLLVGAAMAGITVWWIAGALLKAARESKEVDE